MRSGQGPRVFLAELLLETLVGLPVRGQGLLELAERAQVGAQSPRCDQGVRVVGPEHGPLPLQDVGVQVARVAETALGPQHVGDLELEVQRLLVVRPNLGVVDPEILQAPRQAQARLDLAVLHWYRTQSMSSWRVRGSSHSSATEGPRWGQMMS